MLWLGSLLAVLYDRSERPQSCQWASEQVTPAPAAPIWRVPQARGHGNKGRALM